MAAYAQTLMVSTITTAQIGGYTFERKAPFATTLFEKGGWAYFQLWAYFQEKTFLRLVFKRLKIP